MATNEYDGLGDEDTFRGGRIVLAQFMFTTADGRPATAELVMTEDGDGALDMDDDGNFESVEFVLHQEPAGLIIAEDDPMVGDLSQQCYEQAVAMGYHLECHDRGNYYGAVLDLLGSLID